MSLFGRITGLCAYLLSAFLEYVVSPLLMPLVERNMVPTFLIRIGVRAGLRTRLAATDTGDVASNMAAKMQLVSELREMPIAQATDDANSQHYEVPTAFYSLVLGPYKKYSCGLWPKATTTFEESEVEALRQVCKRAELADRHKILELGCGWGSLTLFMAAMFPHAEITAVSNSATQRAYIEGKCKQQGHTNVRVITADINDFSTEDSQFDRVVSVEMFEHMKNYALLMGRISGWLRPDGKLFVHIFSHRDRPYHFEDGWMAQTFFTGGTMPSDDLLLYFQDDMAIENHWIVNGKHYQRTSEAWLVELDRHRARLQPILEETYGAKNATKWYVNWRLFFIACAELFGFNDGKEWFVSHYLFNNRKGGSASGSRGGRASGRGAGAGATAGAATTSRRRPAAADEDADE